MRLLLVEDDPLLGDAAQRALVRMGYAVDWVRTGRDFANWFDSYAYEVVILDLCLPDDNGEGLLREIRGKPRSPAVIVTTARGGVHDRVALLDLGADDYLVKPYDLNELGARIRSVLRRSPSADARETALCHGPLQLFPDRHSATWNNTPVPLTLREFCVLDVLVRRKNHVLSRAQIEAALYGWGEEIDSNTVEVYIHYLRRKLGAEVIQTVRGVGYQLAPLPAHA